MLLIAMLINRGKNRGKGFYSLGIGAIDAIGWLMPTFTTLINRDCLYVDYCY